MTPRFSKPGGFALRTAGSGSRTSFLSPSKNGKIPHSISDRSPRLHTLFLEVRFVIEERCVNTMAKITAADLGTARLWLSHRRPREQKRTLILAVSRFAKRRRDAASERLTCTRKPLPLAKPLPTASLNPTAFDPAPSALNKFFPFTAVLWSSGWGRFSLRSPQLNKLSACLPPASESAFPPTCILLFPHQFQDIVTQVTGIGLRSLVYPHLTQGTLL